MNIRSTRAFRLSPPGVGQGVSCDADGAFVDTVPLLKRSPENIWEPRDCNELSDDLGARFGVPIDMSSKAAGLAAIAQALNSYDLAYAQLVTLHLEFPEPPSLAKSAAPRSDLIRFIRELYRSRLIKLDWDPDEHPRWPEGAPDSQGGQFARKDDDVGGQDSSGNGNDASGDFHRRDGEDGAFDNGVYHPDQDAAQLDLTAGSAEQLRLNRLQHNTQMYAEIDAWKKKGFVVTTSVSFRNPMTGIVAISDYVVSMWVPDPASFFTTLVLEPILVRDVKTGSGGLTENQKDVYPHILGGRLVIPVGPRAAAAGFTLDELTLIQELYVGKELPSDTVH